MLHVRQSKIPGAGRGVFATFRINEGAVCLRDHAFLIKITPETAEAHKQSGVYWLAFNDRLTGSKTRWYIGLGFSSLINHGAEPNVEISMTPRDEIVVTAIRKIAAGEELLYTYHNAEEYDFETAVSADPTP